MDSIESGQDPSLVQDLDAVPFAGRCGDGGDNRRPPADGQRAPRRIKGRFCPFCTGTIPAEFVFCIHCGRDV
jgi:hypothetical protein